MTPEQVALSKRLHALLARVSVHVSDAVAAAWDELDGYDEEDVATFERRVRPAVAASKTVAVRAATAYYASIAGLSVVSLAVRQVPVDYRSRSPFIAHWHALKEGRPWLEALASGRSAGGKAAGDFVTSTSRRTAGIVASKGRIQPVGWERIPDANACAWCLLVASQTYRTAESADFGHNGCGCTTSPLFE